jgi:hypothetical protein
MELANRRALQKETFIAERDAPSEPPYASLIDREIARRAYEYWEQRGRPIGSPEVDWYRAVDDEQMRHRLGLG